MQYLKILNIVVDGRLCAFLHMVQKVLRFYLNIVIGSALKPISF